MKFLKSIFKFLFYIAVLGGVAGVGGLLYLYMQLEPELPPIDALRDVRMQVPLRIYTRDQRLIAEYGEKRRVPLGYDEIPPQVRQAFLAAEDDRFFEHPGVDYQGLLRAGVQLILTGERRQGGSTITMQVARNFFLSREKTFTRKIKEILLSLRIERELSKQEILELYLNKIYMGNRAYGIGAAAQVYYGRKVGELELPQVAMLAGLPKAPSSSNPIANPQRALERRNYVLGRMQHLGVITAEAYEAARNAPVSAKPHRAGVELQAPYLAEMVRSDLVERYGGEAYSRGLSVTASIDSRLQLAADAAVRSALQAYDRRHGYRGAPAHKALTEEERAAADPQWIDALPAVAGLERALVLEVRKKSVQVLLSSAEQAVLPWQGLDWARPYISTDRRGAKPKKAEDVLKVGDLVYVYGMSDEEGKDYWRLAQIPQVEGALVSMDPSDGAIRALAGGNDYYRSKFNRAVQARRQPGSGFKAFIYSAALEAGFTPASMINDAPLVVQDVGLEDEWRPENYSGKWFGPTRLRKALYKSRNLVSIRVLRSIGADFALEHLKRFGFDTSKLPKNLSLALGSGEVTPLQMARGYSVLANGGYLVEPYFIDRIEDARDGVLYEAVPLKVCKSCAAITQTGDEDPDAAQAQPQVAPRVLSAQNQYLMTSMMKDVVQRGTAVKAKALGRKDLAGKTGTSNEQRDAWFNGFNAGLVAIAWVGFDSFAPLGRGEVGGRAALPAWMDYMRVALDGVPEQTWDLPEGIVTVRIDPKTGKRAPSGSRNAEFEVFRKGNEPAAMEEAVISPFATADSGAAPKPRGVEQTLTQELF